jgi:atypical dual specificity phosphatase
MSEWFTRYGRAWVAPRLAVGAVPLDAHDIEQLAHEGIDRVLNLVQDAEYPDMARLEVEIALEVHGIEEVRVGVIDFGNLASMALESAVICVLSWLEQDHTVYLHCRAGWQRSATVAAAVVVRRHGIDPEAALDLIRQRKPTADPLAHQRQDLRGWWLTRSDQG